MVEVEVTTAFFLSFFSSEDPEIYRIVGMCWVISIKSHDFLISLLLYHAENDDEVPSSQALSLSRSLYPSIFHLFIHSPLSIYMYPLSI